MTQVEREDLFEKLVADCPIEIVFCNLGRNLSEGIYRVNLYDDTQRIEIDNCTTLAEASVVLFHEWRHHNDYLKKRPYALTPVNTISEYYAMSETLQKAYQLRDRDIISAAMDSIVWAERHNAPHLPHYLAAKKVQKLKTWEKCLDFLGVKP